jgi:cell surface protein SprA
METPTFFGTNFNSGMPGLPFVFGQKVDLRDQDQDVLRRIFSMDSLQNQPSIEKFSRTITAGALIEPFPDFRIQVSAERTSAERHSEFFKYDHAENQFKRFSPQFGGNHTISIIAWKTAFSKDNARRESPTFEAFLEHRETVARRLAETNPHSIGEVFDTLSGRYFPFGYGPTSQDVLIPAFIAAYLGRDPSTVSLSAFPKIPIPNWTLTYTGLTRVDFFRQRFNRISLHHAYRANYTVGAYSRNMNFLHDENGFATGLDMSNNFVGETLYENIVISEQFSPLARVSVELRNNFQLNLEMRKSRNLGLSFTNNQITESRTNDWVFGLGYVFRDVAFNVHSGNSRRTVRSDINVRAGVSVRSNVTMLRRIDQRINLASAGSTVTTLNFSADYQLAQNLTVRLFYDQTMNNPELPTMFYNSTTNGGISLRFTINQ